eukprot:m.155359 g.155359  ORF g.155359 m.155359 type:complete len:77 (+) comp16276_c2_seq1:448-678(+)
MCPSRLKLLLLPLTKQKKKEKSRNAFLSCFAMFFQLNLPVSNLLTLVLVVCFPQTPSLISFEFKAKQISRLAFVLG